MKHTRIRQWHLKGGWIVGPLRQSLLKPSNVQWFFQHLYAIHDLQEFSFARVTQLLWIVSACNQN